MPRNTTSAVAESTLDKRDRLIDEYNAATTAGVKASRVRQIRDLQIILVADEGKVPGEDFDLWSPPRSVTSTLTPMTQSEIENKIAARMRVLTDDAFKNYDDLRHGANVGVDALLRAADARGYKVADPRES